MRNALIGYTGFVGSTLCRQNQFSHKYNSSNIQTIEGQEFDLLICAGAPATKWKANQFAAEDLANIERLISSLQTVTAYKIILISTIDVYPRPYLVDENTRIDSDLIEPYGKHRFFLEQFIASTFPHYHIVRLPGLFGRGLKKNFIYDLIHQQCFDLTHSESKFQFYNLERLWSDVQIIMENSIPVINLAPEPVRAKDVALQCFGLNFANQTERPPSSYDMHSCYSLLFGGTGKYIYSAADTYHHITKFVAENAL